MKDLRAPDLFSGTTILGALLVAGCLILATVVGIGWTSARQQSPLGFAPADLTIIPPSTSTPLATETPVSLTTPTPEGQIGIGAYVQITGTEGAGLRIRAEAGQGNETVFLGEEEEIFIVKDGPKLADGFTWWHLVAPYDETRAGWAAADYLAGVPAP
jgi:hypothetical protein